ncbi:hypothetical protein B0H13DRAFT_2365880 [Mycena leptocephala]|nr:hypothetical protein B0H13DRAFT_2365880 [Mycena leptocephala]
MGGISGARATLGLLLVKRSHPARAYFSAIYWQIAWLLYSRAEQEAPPAGMPRGYVRPTGMDGKTISHKKCFIVDAWHYIGHRATDIFADCGAILHHSMIRAFNTETAEQWLNGFESQLRQMSDVNYDFFIHVLMMLYGERVQKSVVAKDLGLSDEFWAEAKGD